MKQISPLKTSIFIFAIFSFSACSKSGSNNPAPQNHVPTITSLSTNQGPYNTSVIITGTGFGSNSANDKVLFKREACNGNGSFDNAINSNRTNRRRDWQCQYFS